MLRADRRAPPDPRAPRDGSRLSHHRCVIPVGTSHMYEGISETLSVRPRGSHRRPQVLARDEDGAAEATGAGAARAGHATGARSHAAAPSARARVGAA